MIINFRLWIKEVIWVYDPIFNISGTTFDSQSKYLECLLPVSYSSFSNNLVPKSPYSRVATDINVTSQVSQVYFL